MDYSTIVEEFKSNFKYSNQGLRKVGLECEFPIVFEDGSAVSYDIIREMFSYLDSKGYELHKDNGTNEVISATIVNPNESDYSSDVVGTDVGYCIMEISFTPDDKLENIESHFWKIIEELKVFFETKKARILGYGVQPVTRPQKSLLANKGRYVFFEQNSLNRFIPEADGLDLHVFATSAATQAHVEVNEAEALDVMNVLNQLSGLQIALTANSPIWKSKVDDQWKAIREIFWDYSWSNRLEQTGIPPHFQTFEEYVSFIAGFKPLMIKRNSEFLKITERKTFMDFLLSKEETKCVTAQGNQVLASPDAKDIHFQGGFAWFDARISSSYGTVESRISCEQPPGEVMVVPAFVLGITENIQEAKELVSEYSYNSWYKLRFDALRNTLNAKINGESIKPILQRVLQIAERGLLKRGLGEEKYLEKLKSRLAENKSPSDRIIDIFKSEGITGLVNNLSY